MSSKEEWCADKLSKLLNEELRISTLNEIKDHLQSLPAHEMKPTVNALNLPLVFDCLNNTNTEQIDLACEVLSLCLDNLNIGESANKYGISLERALAHPYPGVKLMVLKEIERNVQNDDILIDLCRRQSLLLSIIDCMGSEDLGVATKTSNIIKLIGCSDIGIKQLISEASIREFDSVQSVNEINRLRVFETFVNISKESKTSFEYLTGAGLIQPIVNELQTNDVLLKLNIIEVLSQLSSSEHGFEYLELKGVLIELVQILKKESQLVLQLLEPGILKFFGNIGFLRSKYLIENYPYVIERLLENLESNDFSLLGVSLSVFGYIGLTVDGKCSLNSIPAVEKSISVIGGRLGSVPTEIAITALKCLENLLKLKTGNLQVSLVCRKWFFCISDKPMDVILKYAKNPFTEIRAAGLSVLLSIANQLWGQEILKDTPGLMEFLLDRNAEVHKECKEIKYEIVALLSESSVFDHEAINKLKSYVREGPFYVQGELEVAFDSND